VFLRCLFSLIYLLLCRSKRGGRPRRVRCPSSPTRPPPALQNSAPGLLVRLLLKPLPISRGVQLPPCDFFRAVIPAPMTRVSSWSYRQNPAQVRGDSSGDSNGRVSPIVPLILLGSTSEIPFLRSVSVAERVRGVREGYASNPFPGRSINWMIAFPRLQDDLLVWAVRRPGQSRRRASLAFLAESHRESNTKRDARQAQHRHEHRHSHSNLMAGLPI
jgi:hypothetical protein